MPADSARILREAKLPVFTVGSRFGTVGTIRDVGTFGARSKSPPMGEISQRKPEASSHLRAESGG